MSRLTKFSAVLVLAGSVAVFAVSPASATILNLTSAGASGNIGAAFFQQVNDQSTGTGVIDPFLRIQANGTEQGVNSDGPYTMDEKTGIWTHSIKVSDFGVVDLGGVQSIRVLLDVNQTKANPLISLDQLKIYTSATGNLNSLSGLGSSATLVYNLDAGTDNTIHLDYSLNSGSGSGDMLAYLPYSLLAPHSSEYLYLYSQFGAEGGDYASNDGFEEWARIDGEPPVSQVPEPTTLLLLGGGLVGGVLARRRRRAA